MGKECRLKILQLPWKCKARKPSPATQLCKSDLEPLAATFTPVLCIRLLRSLAPYQGCAWTDVGFPNE